MMDPTCWNLQPGVVRARLELRDEGDRLPRGDVLLLGDDPELVVGEDLELVDVVPELVRRNATRCPTERSNATPRRRRP